MGKINRYLTTTKCSQAWTMCIIMMTSSNGSISCVTGLCAGNSPVTGEFPSQRPVTRNFDVFFDLRLNKQLKKQSWGWWFEMPSHSLWHYCNDSWDTVASPRRGGCLFPVDSLTCLPSFSPFSLSYAVSCFSWLWCHCCVSNWRCSKHRVTYLTLTLPPVGNYFCCWMTNAA